MQNYGRGYLAEHQAPKTPWPWARDRYIEYRDKCLYCLKHAAQREWAAAQNQRGNERYEAIRQCALFYGWFAVVASGIVPILHIEEAEEALCKSLKTLLPYQGYCSSQSHFPRICAAHDEQGFQVETQTEDDRDLA